MTMLVRVDYANAALVPVMERFLIEKSVNLTENATPPHTATALRVSWAWGLARCVLEHARKRKGPVVNANGMTTTSASLPTACVVPVLILQGSMLMDRTVMAMENVSLVTVADLVLGSAVLVPAKERETKVKAAMHSPATTLRALMNVNVGPAQIRQGSMVMEGSVITMENVRLVTVRDLLDPFVLVRVQNRKRKAKAATD